MANQVLLAADLQVDAPQTGEEAEFKQRSSSNVRNYEVSKKLSTTVQDNWKNYKSKNRCSCKK